MFRFERRNAFWLQPIQNTIIFIGIGNAKNGCLKARLKQLRINA